MKRYIKSSSESNFTAVWYGYPNGREEESMHVQFKDFNDIDSAIRFLQMKAEKTRGAHWAGAQIEDVDSDVVYEITSDYEVLDNLRIVEEKSYAQ